MKKTALYLFLSGWLVGGLSAGTYTLKAGLSGATLISRYADRPALGFHLGLSRDWDLGSSLALSPELGFVRRGTAEGLPLIGPAIKARIRYDFLELSLPLRWRSGAPSSRFRALLYAGVYGALALSIRNTIAIGDQSWVENLADEGKRVDAGLLAGLGCEFRLFGRAFTWEGRIYNGFPQLNRTENLQPWKNLSVSLLLGFRL